VSGREAQWFKDAPDCQYLLTISRCSPGSPGTPNRALAAPAEMLPDASLSISVQSFVIWRNVVHRFASV
jgi:hypothetical protein